MEIKHQSRLSQILSNAPSVERDELSRLIGPSLIAEIESLTEELQFLKEITLDYQKDQVLTQKLKLTRATKERDKTRHVAIWKREL